MPKTRLENIPLEWVRAFDAAGRHASFTAAAQELGVTQAAISQRIRNLEHQLKASLFLRAAQGVSLTVDGELWLPYVSASLRNLQQSAEDLFGTDGRHLTVTASASITELWLVPRLGQTPNKTTAQYTFKTLLLAADLTADDTIQIRYGKGDWAHKFKAPLFQERIAPVVAPHLLQDGDDWRRLPRIALSGGRPGWDAWAETMGEATTPVPHLRFDSYAPALAAACAGQGVMLASLPLSERMIKTDQLVTVSDNHLLPTETFWILAQDTSLSRKRWAEITEVFCEV